MSLGHDRSARFVLRPLAAAAALFLAHGAQAQQPAADLILTGGEIYTPNGWVEAMAVSKGVIVALGTTKTVGPMKGTDTKVIELAGKTVLPGFHDMHVHPMGGGQQYSECLLKREASPDDIRAAVRTCVARAKPGDWITGGKWVNAVFKDEVQSKALLDEVAPRNPVLLTEETGHSTWANSLALKLAGITRSTPDPLNGVIERDAAGEPTGLLREQASSLVRSKVPPPTEATKTEWLNRGIGEMLSFGITSLQDAGASGSLLAYDALADSGRLKQRIRACINWRYQVGGNAETERLIAMRNVYARDKVKTDCVKIVLDGVPGEGHTAAMLEPYANVIPGDKDDSRKSGILMVPPDVLKKVVTQFDAEGLTVFMHATGDRAARAGVEAIEEARRVNGFLGQRHQVGHSNFTTPQDLAKGKPLGVSFEYSAYLYYWNGVTDVYHKAIGDKRFERFKPLRESIDLGANTIEGSDWTVSPSSNPWIAIETLITRLRPGGGGTRPPLALKEAITMKEAIDIYTINSARHLGDSDRLGSIETGKLADLIVIDRNPFKVPIEMVHDTKVETAIVGGEVVYTAK